jgi:peptidoglycan/LPS O-acetylase OafA/YrhL
MPETQHAANNFNLLRLVFALMVVAYHIVLVVPAWWWSVREPMAQVAEIGVQGFFVLSGYLVLASFERSASLGLYAEKRLRRLYPAYAVVILACAAAALAVSPAARADLAAVARYLGWNLVFANFMEPKLPGIFVENGGAEVNGALWTLKIEVMFYLVLPVLAWLLRVAGKLGLAVFVLIYAGAEAWRILFTQQEQHELARQLPGQMSYFITGMMLYRWRLGGWRIHVAGVIGAALFAASLILPEAQPARALGLGALAVWVATGWPRLPDAARFGDLSYGVYIVHFPIIQTVAVLGVFVIDRWLGVAVSVTTSVIAALLLWYLVEKPALRRDSAYRRPAAG